MSELLAQFHPDLQPLYRDLRAALVASVPGTQLGLSWRARVVLARVSDESRKKFEENLDTDMDWLCGDAEAAWVKANVTDVEAFRATPAGAQARARVGMAPLYAPGTKRLIGGYLARNGWLFVFLLSSAAKADLPQGRNAATEAILASLLTVAHDDPHDVDGRPVLYAHALDRILRAEPYAWAVFSALTSTYALVNAAGRMFDALGHNAKDEWTLIVFGASRGRDDTARRFLLARLNKLRAGNWPGNAAALPHGFTPSSDPDDQGRLVLEPAADKRSVRRPVPDPRQRWVVQSIAQCAMDRSVTNWSQLARACGNAGVLSKGADEAGVPLSELRDLTSAGRLLLTAAKVRAYCTGLLRHTETGVTPGQFTPGDGHRLEPRFPGDTLGAVSHDVRVGRPEDQGWDWGVTGPQWRDILLKFCLPRDFVPEGWSWLDEPALWGWTQILACAESERPAMPTGGAAGDRDMRPLTGLKWSDATHRYLLHHTSQSNAKERYEWRSQEHAAARHDKNGAPYKMASTDGVAICSWAVEEFHAAWADLALQAWTSLIAGHPDVGEAHLPRPRSTDRMFPAAPDAAAVAARDAAVGALRQSIDLLLEEADALTLSAALRLRQGDEAAARRYERQASAKESEISSARQRLADLLAEPVLRVPVLRQVADFGTPAAIVAALTGPYASGPAPKALRDAVHSLGGGDTRLDLVDATTVKLTVKVSARRSDGTLVSASAGGTLRRSRPHTATAAGRQLRAAAKAELARKWFYEGISLDELTRLAGCNRGHAYRLVREQLATGAPRSVGQARLDDLAAERIPLATLRTAIVAHPVAEARAGMWSCLNPNDPLPGALPKGYAALIEETYRQAATGWSPHSTLRDGHADARVDIMTVLRHLPDPTVPVPVDRLAILSGIAVRNVNVVSLDSARCAAPLPASLHRVGGWGGPGSSNLPPEQRAVRLLACPWTDCPSPVADLLMLVPEVVIGCQSSVICRYCLRPPTRNVALTAGYGDLASSIEDRTGAWVHCASPMCALDLGAGPGLLWRWDDAPARHVIAHPQCMPEGEGNPTSADVRAWAKRNGLQVTNRGKVPAAVVAAYAASGARTQ